MNIWYFLTNTFFAMLSAVLIYIFLIINFDSFKCSKIRLFTFLSLFGILNGTVSTLWTQVMRMPNEFQLIKPVMISLLSIYAIKIILKVNWRKTVLAYFIIILAMGIGNFLTTILFSGFGIIATAETVSKDAVLYLYVNISIYIIALLVIFLTQYVYKLRNIKNLKPISILLGMSVLVMVANNSVNFSKSFNLVSYVIALVSSIVFFIFTLIFINKYQKGEEQSEELRQQKFYNESLKDTLQKLRRIKHDQADHLSVLKFMIKNKNFDEADKYISEIQNNPDSIVNTAIYNIENVALFGIISTKIDKANNAGIKFNLKTAGTINSIPKIKVSEICEILGIFLDNAIEAAEISSEKLINMAIIEYTDNIDIKISNSCDQLPIMGKLKTDGYSTKGVDRGHGLAIVETILKKYKTVINIMTFDDSIMQFNQQIKIKKAP